MSNETLSSEKTLTLFEALKQLGDARDRRGKRHDLAFVLCGCVLAIMAGRSYVSSIHRFLRHRLRWLEEITETRVKRCVSRAQLPRILERVDWESLNHLLQKHLGIQIQGSPGGEWIAIDGKALRGSPGEQIVSARTHESQIIVAQTRMAGKKSSEVSVVRALLKASDLQGRKLTLDALHCNPETTALIHENQGGFVIQVKANQPHLLKLCHTLETQEPPLGSSQSVEKGHGRLEERQALFFPLPSKSLDPKWNQSGLQGLVRVERKTEELTTKHLSREVSYYVTNQFLEAAPGQREISQAIRQHWGVESYHWIRDVTFSEDKVRVKHSNQSHILSLLRTCAIGIFKKVGGKNMRENLEKCSDSKEFFTQFLCQAGFL